MNLPEDTHLAYIVWHEAWYRRADDTDPPHLMVSASAQGTGGGVAWEFQIDGYELGGSPVTRIKMFDDAYAALAQMPEFFATLAERQPGTLTEVRAILDALGAVDETPRVSPYAENGARITEPRALDQIAALLAAEERDADTLDGINAIVRSTGRNADED